ncbi:MAG: radical SAM protein [Victivallales bacterium]
MNIALIRFRKRENARQTIPWHFSFYKDIIEPFGHKVDIIDDQVEEFGIDKLVEISISNRYRIIGTGGIGTTYNELMDFSEKIKRRSPDTIIIVGGQITADYELIMKTCPVDIIVRGEGEITLPKIVEAVSQNKDIKDIPGIIFRRNGKLFINDHEKLIHMDGLPDYNFKNIDINKYDTSVSDYFLVDEKAVSLKKQGFKALYVFIARGCPYSCFFCYRHLKGYRSYGRERLDNILSGIKEKGFSFLSFGDECITANKENLLNVCELAKKYDIYWITSARADRLDKETMTLLKTHNCVGLQVGIESFDKTMLVAMNKRTTPRQNIDAMNILYEYRLRTVLQIVSGSPGENRKTILNTRQGMWSCFFMEDKIASAILNPYPGSPAYYYGIEKGLIKDKEWVHRNFSSKGEIIVNFSEMSIRELKTWQVWFFVEAALSYRVKNMRLIINRSLLTKIRAFLSNYYKLTREPLNFISFNCYLLMGFKYWLKPHKIDSNQD